MALLPTGSISRPQDGMRMEMDSRAVRFQRAVPHENWRKGDSCSGSAPHKHKAHPSPDPWATFYGYIGSRLRTIPAEPCVRADSSRSFRRSVADCPGGFHRYAAAAPARVGRRSEEHTSELQSLMRI